jgi:hypothetical protein
MAKHNKAKLEKAERNKIYAKKFERNWEQEREHQARLKEIKQRGGKYGAWCRIMGHPPNCDCVYPERSTLKAGR